MSAKITIRQRRPFDNKWAQLTRRALRKSIARVLVIHDYTDINRQDIERMVKSEPMQDNYKALYRDVGVHFAEVALSQLKKRGAIMLTKEWSDVWAREFEAYAINKAGRRITWVNEYTKEVVWDKMSMILKEVRSEGLSISLTTDRIQKELIKEMGSVERWRAMRIAQTEVLTASNRGGFVAARDSGLEMVKTWITGGQNIRPTHQQAAIDNVNVPMDKPFLLAGINIEMPGDPALPPEEAINCKCTVIYDPL